MYNYLSLATKPKRGRVRPARPQHGRRNTHDKKNTVIIVIVIAIVIIIQKT